MKTTAPLARRLSLEILLLLSLALAEPIHGQEKSATHENIDSRVNAPVAMPPLTGAKAAASANREALARTLEKGIVQLKATVPGGLATISSVTGSVEVVSAAGTLTEAAPGRSGFDIVKDFLQANASLYGLKHDDLANLHFLGESVSPASGLRMVRVEQRVNGHPVFQSESRFTMDREGRLIRSVGLMVPNATTTAAPAVAGISAQGALVSAMASVGIALEASRMHLANTALGGRKTEVVVNAPQVTAPVPSELVYFPIAPGVLVPAWSQVSFTNTDGDYLTLVDANSGVVLWRKNIRAHASTHDARFSVYVQADGKTPADSPAPLSPTTVITGSGTQPAAIARTTVSMFAAQDLTASPNGWIPDGGTTTTGDNVDAYLERDGNDVPDSGTLDSNGRPTGNLDSNGRNRDFLGAGYDYTPPPQGGNAEAGSDLTDLQYQRGVVTQLFYLTNWYHDRLHALGFDAGAGNFQTDDPVLAEVQKAVSLGAVNNAFFSAPPDGTSGRMGMFIWNGPTVDRDGSLDATIVFHELTHGLSNRLIGNGSGLMWHVGGGMGEGWSDFYALSLLNHTSADLPGGKYATGAYATYKFGGLTDNYLYGIRRFPYSTDNAVNPLTWADIDDVTNNVGGGIAPSPRNQNENGGCQVHNIGEIWCNTLWEVRSRIIADPAGANGDVPAGNDRMLQIVTDAMKMTPLNPSFLDARDALIAADAAHQTNPGANEKWIWQGFADRGLGYNAVAPFSRMYSWRAGHVSVGESFDEPYLDVQSVAIDDSIGNNNGAVDPNEPVRITVKLKNPWRKASFGVASATATLATSTAGVVITTASSTYPAIPALSSADGTKFQFTVPAVATAGQSLSFTVTVVSALGSKAVDFTMRVGTPAGNGNPLTYTSTIPGGLAIPDDSPRGVANTLTITDDHEIADLNFRLDSLTHPWTGEITALLRAPNGLGSDLISVVGFGPNRNTGSPGDNFINTVIDDQATGSLLFSEPAAAPFTGSWKATFNDNWSGRDPVGQLSRYIGLSTKGAWKCLVSDQTNFFFLNTGKLNAWSLIVTPKAYTIAPYCPPDGADWTWARQAGGAGADSGKAVAVDGAGYVFVTGSFSGSMSFPGSATILTASGGTDFFLAKYDASGTLLWAVRAGGLADDAGNGVALDGAGNAYVTGEYRGAAVLNLGNGCTLPATAGGSDIFVAKYSPGGNCQWAVRKGNAGGDRGFGIAVAPNSNVLVTGTWELSGLAEVFVLKLRSSDGFQLGAAFSTGPAGHGGVGRAIAVDANNDVYVSGNYSPNSISFPTGAAPLTAPAFSGGFTRAYVVKFDQVTLNASWLRHSSNGSATFSHDATGIAVDPTSAAVYVTAYFNGTADFGNGTTLVNTKNGNTFTDQLYDYFIVKLNTSDASLGSPIWAIKGNGDPASDDETRGIAVDTAGHPYVTGFLHPGASSPFVNEGSAVLVANYSSDGALRWMRNAEDVPTGSPEDTGLGIAVDRDGCVHLTGDFTEVLDFLPAGSLTSNPTHVRDMFVAKVCSTCSGLEDTDGDGFVNVNDLDDDNDGMSDVWELMWGFDPLIFTNGSLDSDGDGTITRLEYAFGLNPTVFDAGSIIVSNGVIVQRGLPTLLLANAPGGANFRALFGRRKDYLTAHLTYTAQFSADLVTWVSSTTVPTVIADDGEIEAVTVPHPFFVNGRKARFFRLQVTTPPIP